MPTDKQANLVDHVLFATNDYPCMARGCGEKAILRMSEGVFGPCAKHESILTVEFTKVKVPWFTWPFKEPLNIPKAKALK